ncbi:MAG: 1-deoxy-D-xylulose-5-phosphate reductoisomerase, partial [Armatimonadota bacterium]
EVAVGSFLEGKIGFLDIVRIVHDTMDKHLSVQGTDLQQILDADSWARETARQFVEELIG